MESVPLSFFHRLLNLIINPWASEVQLGVMPSWSTSPENMCKNLKGLFLRNSSKVLLLFRALLTRSGSQGCASSVAWPPFSDCLPCASVSLEVRSGPRESPGRALSLAEPLALFCAVAVAGTVLCAAYRDLHPLQSPGMIPSLRPP